MLETDASIDGIGAVLGQYQTDGHLHPVSYASRALSTPERNYSITDLETLAVVWAISHFHNFLYGHIVTIYTDHTAVKSVLEAPNPAGKHARWWTKVYGRGLKDVRIVYRAEKENKNADALSRSPVLPAPQVGLAEEEVQVSPLVVAPCSDNDRPESRQTSGPDCLMATHPTISECTLTTELSEDILTDLRGLFGQHQGELEPGAEGGGFADSL